jgi:hypothetical protein
MRPAATATRRSGLPGRRRHASPATNGTTTGRRSSTIVPQASRRTVKSAMRSSPRRGVRASTMGAPSLQRAARTMRSPASDATSTTGSAERLSGAWPATRRNTRTQRNQTTFRRGSRPSVPCAIAHSPGLPRRSSRMPGFRSMRVRSTVLGAGIPVPIATKLSRTTRRSSAFTVMSTRSPGPTRGTPASQDMCTRVPAVFGAIRAEREDDSP